MNYFNHTGAKQHVLQQQQLQQQHQAEANLLQK
jgi:hypothetical protein